MKDSCHPQLGKGGGHQVTLAGGYAASDQQDIELQTLSQDPPEFTRFVRGDRQDIAVAAPRDRQRLEHDGVRIANLSGTGRLLRCHQFVTGRHDRHAGARIDQYAGTSHRGKQPQARWAQPASPAQDDVSGAVDLSTHESVTARGHVDLVWQDVIRPRSACARASRRRQRPEAAEHPS